MADHKTIDKILRQVEELSLSDRMKLVESIVRSVRLSEDRRSHGETADTPETLFALWRDRAVTLSETREKAWRRPLSFLRHKRPSHGKATIDKTMQYFPDSDVLHIVIREGPEAGSVELSPHVTAELDENGEIIGIEITDATAYVCDRRV